MSFSTAVFSIVFSLLAKFTDTRDSEGTSLSALFLRDIFIPALEEQATLVFFNPLTSLFELKQAG